MSNQDYAAQYSTGPQRAVKKQQEIGRNLRWGWIVKRYYLSYKSLVFNLLKEALQGFLGREMTSGRSLWRPNTC